MTISSIQRPASIQHTTTHYTFNRTHSHEATRSEVEGHIQMLINEGNVFEARCYMNMVNKLNGYPVISAIQFKQWHISYLRNQKSNSKNHFSKIKNEKLDLKYQNQNSFSKYQNQNSQKENQKSNIKNSSFHAEFQKAYMKLISN